MAQRIRLVEATEAEAAAIKAEEEQRSLEWLQTRASNKIVACRGQQHSWDLLIPGTNSRYITTQPMEGRPGVVEVTFKCKVCGKKRRMVTAPGGAIERPAHYTYEDPDGFRPPRGSGIKSPTRAQFTRESDRRWLEDYQDKQRLAEKRAAAQRSRRAG